MKVVPHNPYVKETKVDVKLVSKDELLKVSEYITVARSLRQNPLADHHQG